MCHVLIIEDDWLIADHIAPILESAGASSVGMAETEEEAVARALANPPAVIISDIDLGSGGTGPAAVKRITASLGHRAVMFVTGEPRSFQPPSPSMHLLHKPSEDRTIVETFQAITPLGC